MSDEIGRDHPGVRRVPGGRGRGDAAAAGLPAVPQQHAAAPHQGASTTPTPRASSCGRRSSASATSTRSRPTSPSSTPASPSASGWRSPAGSSTATAAPVRHQLVEIWQANAGGRYIHKRDQHPAAIDPNFTGVGRCLTDADGVYTFTTIKPGPYPWKNHRNAWRPAHIHFSLFGTDFTQRMVTQMYFPGDPLFALDPIYQSIVDPRARERLVATYDHDVTQHEWSTGYRWDIVLTGSHRTPLEEDGRS